MLGWKHGRVKETKLELMSGEPEKYFHLSDNTLIGNLRYWDGTCSVLLMPQKWASAFPCCGRTTSLRRRNGRNDSFLCSLCPHTLHIVSNRQR